MLTPSIWFDFERKFYKKQILILVFLKSILNMDLVGENVFLNTLTG